MGWWAGKGETNTILLWMRILEKVGKLGRAKMSHRLFYSEKLRFKKKKQFERKRNSAIFAFVFRWFQK